MCDDIAIICHPDKYSFRIGVDLAHHPDMMPFLPIDRASTQSILLFMPTLKILQSPREAVGNGCLDSVTPYFDRVSRVAPYLRYRLVCADKCFEVHDLKAAVHLTFSVTRLKFQDSEEFAIWQGLVYGTCTRKVSADGASILGSVVT
jgi:hypothetical protein